MQLFIVASLIFINLLLWLVMLLRFKNLFSTQNILQEFRGEMESLIKDAQRNTALSINLIDEKIKELKAVSAEAERKVSILRHELESQKSGAALEREIKTKTAVLNDAVSRAGRSGGSAPAKNRRGSSSAAQTAQSAKNARNSGSKSTALRAAARYRQEGLPGEDEAVALTGLFAENAQKSLFDPESPQITVTSSGDSYGKVPILKADVHISDQPLVPKKSFARRVKDMADLGRSVDEIAAATNHSTTEVQLVLDMS